MSLTNTQQQSLAAHIRANADQAIIDALVARNDGIIADAYNLPSATEAWRPNVSREELFDNTPIAQFDSLSAGKRDAWKIIMMMDVVNFTRGKIRAGIKDVWKNVNTKSETMLRVGIEKATIAEELFGGQTRTTNAINATNITVPVSAINRKWFGQLSTNDVSFALNKY